MSKSIFFASDFHLGIDAFTSSSEREKKIVRWLDSISDNTEELYLVGDVFDYWFEYGKAVPKGYVRLMGMLSEFRDAGIPVYFFTGNHDMWMFHYFEDELGIPIYRQPLEKQLKGKNFFIGHGDGLGPGDKGYKLIKSIFNNKLCQGAFKILHPDIGISLMKYFSAKSRQYTGTEDPFGNPDREWLVQFSESYSLTSDTDYFVFGHRHLPVDYLLSNGKSRYINLGEWLYACSYGEWDGRDFKVKFFESSFEKVYGI